MRELIRRCHLLDSKYEPYRWFGDTKNDSAEEFIYEMRDDSGFYPSETDLIEMEPFYPYVLGKLKGLCDEEHRRLFLKNSKVLNYMAEIEQGEVAELVRGDFPPLEALICDVAGCSGQTYLGWRPLTERIGRKVCEYHWLRHKDAQDSFDLLEAFGFRRPPGIRKPVVKNDVARCDCGRERPPGRKFCTECAAERERLRKKKYYHGRKSRPPEPVVDENALQCKQCGGGRQLGHSFCEKCADRRKKQSNRERRRRSYRKAKTVRV